MKIDSFQVWLEIGVGQSNSDLEPKYVDFTCIRHHPIWFSASGRKYSLRCINLKSAIPNLGETCGKPGPNLDNFCFWLNDRRTPYAFEISEVKIKVMMVQHIPSLLTYAYGVLCPAQLDAANNDSGFPQVSLRFGQVWPGFPQGSHRFGLKLF